MSNQVEQYTIPAETAKKIDVRIARADDLSHWPRQGTQQTKGDFNRIRQGSFKEKLLRIFDGVVKCRIFHHGGHEEHEVVFKYIISIALYPSCSSWCITISRLIVTFYKFIIFDSLPKKKDTQRTEGRKAFVPLHASAERTK